MGWNRKKGRGNKYFKKDGGGGNLGQGVGALKGGLEAPYEVCLVKLEEQLNFKS